MAVLRELLGIECARCREAGHRCQAQIRIDEVALCLRCADDEPCIFVTAAQLSEASPVNHDPCAVPAPSREDLRAVRAMPAIPSIHATKNTSEEYLISDQVKAAILADTSYTFRELAAKHHLSRDEIRNIVRAHKRKMRGKG